MPAGGVSCVYLEAGVLPEVARAQRERSERAARVRVGSGVCRVCPSARPPFLYYF